jgi:hypothetical protein
MQVGLAAVLSCSLLVFVACDTARNNQGVDETTTANNEPRTEGPPKIAPEQAPSDVQGQPSLSSNEVRKKNEEMLARLAEEEQRRSSKNATPIEESGTNASETADSPASDREREVSNVDLSGYERRLSELVERYEEIRTTLRRATTDCEPKRTQSSGVIRDPATGEWVTTSESGWIQGSPAACAEARELEIGLSELLREYDRQYNDYTLEAMQHGMMLHVVRRQLPLPNRR